MKVAPLRETILQDIMVAVRDNRFDKNSIPKFKMQLEGVGVADTTTRLAVRRGYNEQREPFKGKLFENKEFRHVFEAMKKNKVDIEQAIKSQRPIFFDAAPICYDDEQVDIADIN